MEARMADLDDTVKTLMTQGKFIHSADRLAAESRARKLRAEVISQAGRSVAATLRGWFRPRPVVVLNADRGRPRAA
jgi:hypothetical protein